MLGVWTPLLRQQLAHELAGPLAVIGGDVKMGDCSYHERAQGGNLDATLCRRGGDRRSVTRPGVDDDDIRLDVVRIDSGRDAAGYGVGKGARSRVIISQSLHMMIKGVQARGGEYPGLAPAGTEPLSHDPRFRNVLSSAHQH